MPGDTIRDAFRTELQLIIDTANPPILWDIVDIDNTANNPDASTGFFALEFIAGDEEMITFGAPGANYFREHGQVTLMVFAPLSKDRNIAEQYARQIRIAFRTRRFSAGSQNIRIDGTYPMGNGFNAGGMWCETVALSYNCINVG